MKKSHIASSVKLLMMLPLMALLYGCASTTAGDLRKSPKLTNTIEVNVNYQVAHERILNKLRECNGEGSGGVGVVITIPNEIYSEAEKSNIAWLMSSSGLQKYHLQIDLTAIDSDKTRIQSYAIHSGWQKTLNLIQAWATDPNSTC